MIITSGILIQVMTIRQTSNRGKLINTQNFQLFEELDRDHKLPTLSQVLLNREGLGLRWILNWNLTGRQNGDDKKSKIKNQTSSMYKGHFYDMCKRNRESMDHLLLHYDVASAI